MCMEENNRFLVDLSEPGPFRADFQPKFSKFLRGRKISRSKSRMITPKSMPLRSAPHAQDPNKSQTTVLSVGMLRRVRLHAISDRNFRNFFAPPQNFAFEIA